VRKVSFEWDQDKDEENQAKHGVSFTLAQQAFLDPRRVIVEDLTHSGEEIGFIVLAALEMAS